MTYRVMSWDWREQPDMNHLNRLIHEIIPENIHYEGLYLTMVDDTGDDQYAIVITTRPLTQPEARTFYLDWLRKEATE